MCRSQQEESVQHGSVLVGIGDGDGTGDRIRQPEAQAILARVISGEHPPEDAGNLIDEATSPALHTKVAEVKEHPAG